MVTTEAGDEKVKQSKELGAVGYIKKPFQPQDIKNTLCTIMGEEIVDETDHDDELETGDF
jgi:CheY-like chemotaxis protein